MRSSAPRLLLLLATVWSLSCGQAPPDRIVVVTLDTTRADALGAYGQTSPASPRIDAMAADGFVFEQAVTSAPSTFPSHATLFTGKQPYAHGVRSNSGYELAQENITLAEILKAAGWATHAEVAAPVMARRTRLDQGFDLYRDPGLTRSRIDAIERQQHDHRYNRPAEEITERGLEFLREHADSPFFLWLHYFDAHQPVDPPERFRPGLSPYHAEVRRIDHHVGLLLDELEALGLRERTLVVLTSDHGEGFGQHGEKTHSFYVYDSTMRVPLIFWGADAVPAGRRAPALVRLVDVTPTLLDLVGLPPLEGIQGVSLRPIFERPRADLGLTGYGESAEPMLAFGSSLLRFVQQGSWKYIHKLEPELYDVARDPREVRNLADDHPDVVAEMRDRLEALIDAAPENAPDATVELDAESLAELQALGYVAANATGLLDDERAALVVRGPDPTDRIDDLALYASAMGLVSTQKHEEALEILLPLAEQNPESPAILQALIGALDGSGRNAELRAALRRGLVFDPDSTAYRWRLARALADEDPAEAERLLRQVIERKGCEWQATVHLANLLRVQGRRSEQRDLLEQRFAACPDEIAVRNALSWVLATSLDPEVRDGGRAVELAAAAVAESEGRHPGYLDTLAAAYAETGDFERARLEQGRALAIVEGRDLPPGILESFQKHEALLAEGQPIRDL